VEAFIMTKAHLLAAVLGTAALFCAPAAPAFAAPQERGEKAKPEYHFRQEDTAKLKQNYKGRAKVDWDHREHLVAGGRLPNNWRAHLEPVPKAVIAELPPVPAGCAIGYINGYAVVYDPATLEIIDVVDLQ
jgi:hypothetical protein